MRIESEYTAPIAIDVRWSTVRFAEAKGQRVGHWITWYVNGQKHSEGTYADGKREGSWQFWKSDGTVDAALSGSYAAGTRTGP